MKHLFIPRIAKNCDGVFGVLVYENVPFAVTLEPEDKGNQANISCIPAGQYICERVNSPRFGDTFQVKDVADRSHVLFHKGNTEDNTQGCILVAESFTEINGKIAIGDSKGGYGDLMELMKDDDSFRLSISWATRV